MPQPTDADRIALAEAWIAQDPDPQTRAELGTIVDRARSGDDAAAADLADRFDTRLAFGTAGLRGEIAAGPNRMNRVLVSQGAAGLAAYLLDRSDAGTALTPIASLDVPRYMGKWYEIAKFPNRFQKKCIGFTKADYSLKADGTVQVINSCMMDGGGTDEAKGVARQVGGANSPKLEVRFAPAWLAFIPGVWGDYWVVDLDEDYSLAAVGEPEREYLWVLSRTPTIDRQRYEELAARLARKGFDVGRLVPTRQED